MYLKEQNLLIAAIDHGFCTIKTPNMVFDNGVQKLKTEPAFAEKTMCYEGKFYKVGEGRLSMKDEKTEDDDYFILTLAAIAYEMDIFQLMHADVVIAAGLPFGRFGVEKDRFADYLKRGFVRFDFNGRDYSCKIVDVKLFPQCYAAVANRLGNMAPEQLIVDIGSKTVDVVHTKNHRPVETECFSIPEALIACTRQVENAVYNQLNRHIPEEQIQKVMMTGNCTYSEKYVAVMKTQIRNFAEEVEGKLKENGFDPDITPIIYCGGGATVMKHYGKIRGSNICYMDDVKANAVGYEFITGMMLQK